MSPLERNETVKPQAISTPASSFIDTFQARLSYGSSQRSTEFSQGQNQSLRSKRVVKMACRLALLLVLFLKMAECKFGGVLFRLLHTRPIIPEASRILDVVDHSNGGPCSAATCLLISAILL